MSASLRAALSLCAVPLLFMACDALSIRDARMEEAGAAGMEALAENRGAAGAPLPAGGARSLGGMPGNDDGGTGGVSGGKGGGPTSGGRPGTSGAEPGEGGTSGVQDGEGGTSGVQDGEGGSGATTSRGGTGGAPSDVGGAGLGSGGLRPGGSSEGGGHAGESVDGPEGSAGGGGKAGGGEESTGGAGEAAGSSGSAGANWQTDSVPPTVLSVLPAPDSTGVASSTPVALEFSEPMNRESVEQAISISDVDLGSVSLEWNDDTTVLTIAPLEGWLYADGTDPDLAPAMSYVVGVSPFAMDLAGNFLAHEFSSTFSTLRRITETVHPGKVLHYDSYTQVANECPPTENLIRIGYTSSRSATAYRYGLIAFDSTVLPDAVVEVERVGLMVMLRSASTDFFDTGTVEVEALGRASWDVGSSVLDDSVKAIVGTLQDQYSVATPELDLTEIAKVYWPDEHFYRIASRDSPVGSMVTYGCRVNLTFTYVIP